MTYRDGMLPHDDIPASLADTIGLYAQNEQVFESFHSLSEEHFELFRLAHMHLKLVSSAAFSHTDREAAFEIGIRSYEIFSTVSASENLDTTAGIARGVDRIHELLAVDTAYDFAALGSESAEIMLFETPRLYEAVGEIATRFLHDDSLVAYAAAGAGIVRSIHQSVEVA